MSFYYSLLAAFIPMSIYLLLIWRLDKYEREPFGKVAVHFLWGAFGAILLAIIFSSFFNATAKLILTSKVALSFFASVIVAPFVEELVKALFLFRSYKQDYFDNLTDGLVYGGAIGLGFGMTENLFYFISYDQDFSQWISIVITRSIFSAVMHTIATATVGAFLAKAKFGTVRNKTIFIFSGFSLAIFFHAAWNFSLTFEFTYYLGILFMLFLISSFIIIFYSSLNKEREIITNGLVDELFATDIVYEHKSKRFLFNSNNVSLDKRSQKKAFISFATKLAFRKLQYENSSGIQKERYLSEIKLLREKLTEMIKND